MGQGEAVSDEIRLIIVNMRENLGLPTEFIAKCCLTTQRTVQRILAAYRATGEIGVKRSTGRKRKLSPAIVQDLIDFLESNPECQLLDFQNYICTHYSIQVDLSTISRYLKASGISLKTITKAATERDPAKRALYVAEIAAYEPHELVFIDESSFDRRTCNRTRAWSRFGCRVIRSVFFFRGERYSMLPALSLEDGIFHVHTVKGSYNMENFHWFIQTLLQHMNRYDANNHPKNSVIVLDNAKIHTNPITLEMIEKCGMRYVFIAPYSPDFNPIELAFSSMKFWCRKHKNEVARAWQNEAEARDLLMHLAFTATPRKARGWFRHCQYIM